MITCTKQMIFSSEYTYAEYLFFQEGLCRVINKSDKRGFIDISGKEVIPCKYEGALPFEEGLSAVRLNGKRGYINKVGETGIPCIYDYGDSFKNGLAKVELGGKYGCVKVKGEEVIPCSFDMIYI